MSITNLKFLLICFELLSGMKINFHKSEVLVLGAPGTEQARVANLLNCKQGTLPFNYLGFPMCDRRITMAEMEPLVNAVALRMEPWQGRFMSSAARLTLINACFQTSQFTIWACSSSRMVRMKALTDTDADFSGKDKEIRENTIWWLGRTFVSPRPRVDLAL
jgi:hypothetical protein